MKSENIEDVVGCRFVDVPSVIDDRGVLCFAESEKAIPFSIQRMFWVYGVGKGKNRGGHSHRTCSEVVFAVSGSCAITVDDGRCSCCAVLDSASRGLLIPAGVWCSLHDFSSDAVLVVAASEHYDAKGYINEYSEFLKCK